LSLMVGIGSLQRLCHRFRLSRFFGASNSVDGSGRF
jgi:hypothetical protein